MDLHGPTIAMYYDFCLKMSGLIRKPGCCCSTFGIAALDIRNSATPTKHWHNGNMDRECFFYLGTFWSVHLIACHPDSFGIIGSAICRLLLFATPKLLKSLEFGRDSIRITLELARIPLKWCPVGDHHRCHDQPIDDKSWSHDKSHGKSVSLANRELFEGKWARAHTIPPICSTMPLLRKRVVTRLEWWQYNGITVDAHLPRLCPSVSTSKHLDRHCTT